MTIGIGGDDRYHGTDIVLQNLERTTREIAALAGKLNANPSVILTGEPEKEDPFK